MPGLATEPEVLVSLSHSSAHMKNASPAFIVGHPRSGTSLIYRTLQQLPAFRPKKIDLHETQIFLHLGQAFRFDSHPPRQLLAFMLGDRDHFNAFLQETRLLRRAALLSTPLSLPLRGDLPLPLWRAQGLHFVVRSYLWHAWAARGCARLVEKSPRNVPHAEKLRLVSPASLQIFMSRHPVDVFSSYRRRAQVDPKAQWANISRPRFTRIYRNAVARALTESTSRGDSFLLTRYEDFTLDPAAELNRICRFLDEPFDESALAEVQPPQRQGRQTYQHLYGAIQTHTKQWNDFVDVSEAHRLEDDLRDVMTELGYNRYT